MVQLSARGARALSFCKCAQLEIPALRITLWPSTAGTDSRKLNVKVSDWKIPCACFPLRSTVWYFLNMI